MAAIGNVSGGRGDAFLPAAACLAAGMLVALAVIPPWQNPDEPQHLLTVRLVMAHGPDFVLDRDVDPASERQIVASMAAHGWWRHYGAVTPDPLPETFAEGPALVTHSYFGAPGGGSRLYYRGMAVFFRAAGLDSLLAQLYAMRVLSALATLVALWGIWTGTLTFMGFVPAVAITAAIALHPQFALVATTASPDALVNMAGALMWRQAAILLVAGATMPHLAGLWAAALTAVAIRRMGAPLLLPAAVVTIVALAREMAVAGVRWGRVGAGLAGVAAVGFSALLAGNDLSRAFAWMQFDPQQSLASIASGADRMPAFFEMMYRTFWLSGGWVRHAAPGWWYAITFAIVGVSLAGLVLLLPKQRRQQALWFSLALATIQIGSVVAYYFGIVRSGPQGRYLFPIVPAVFCLIWLGWSGAVGRIGPPRVAAVSLVLLMAFLNTTAWVFVLLPAYR